MKAKKPVSKASAGTWVEMTGFKSERDRLTCLALYKAGLPHEFRKSLLRSLDGKLWFLVRTHTFTGRARTQRELKTCAADVNRRGSENICKTLLSMLKAAAKAKVTG